MIVEIYEKKVEICQEEVEICEEKAFFQIITDAPDRMEMTPLDTQG